MSDIFNEYGSPENHPRNPVRPEGEQRVVYELLDGAIQTVALYSNYEAAEEHAEDASRKRRGDLDIVERRVHDKYVPDGHDWRG